MEDERFLGLWTDYLEGELDEAGAAELRALMEADGRRRQIAADAYQTHRLLGLLAGGLRPGSEEFVRQTMDRLPADGEGFSRRVMRRLRRRPGEGPAMAGPSSPRAMRQHRRPSAGWGIAASAVAVAAVALLAVGRRPDDRGAVRDDAGVAIEGGGVRLANAAGARFFGELTPPARSELATRRDYVLIGGMVELAFPDGASAIIEGPAVFRVLPDEGLGLDVGRCSVHAPAGAEGFRVETPVTRVVDRGTRFLVSVAETSETEVQVIEGAADVFGRPESLPGPSRAPGVGQDPTATGGDDPGAEALEVRLTGREARRFAGPGPGDMGPARFSPSSYRRGLPDRVVSYEATADADGLAVDLESIAVQRGGQLHRYAIDQLISVELSWFRSGEEADPHGHLAGGAELPPRRGDLLSDAALNTGVINPGGSDRPLEADPVLDGGPGPGTPGLGVRFRRPVVNGPGPDVVLFELQTALNPPDGDAFHVSPMEFRGGRRSMTVRAFDLTMTSPEALELGGFFLYRSRGPVASTGILESGECVRMPRSSRFHAMAVGIDLSDLGFREGEEAVGLFFQDARDDTNVVDPVLIAGLPAP